MQEKYRDLFKPIKISGCEIKNRFFMAPMGCFGLVDQNGILTDDGVEYYMERAKGGIGLIITGICIVENEFEKIRPAVLFCTKDTNGLLFRKQMRKLTDRVHTYGSKIFLQLSSGFGRVAPIPRFATSAVAPSVVENKWDPGIIHRELLTEEVEQYIDSFGRAAETAKECGFDGVEIHAVHEGYLLDQFATECFNKRTDRFGGSFENRYRFATEIVHGIKTICGSQFPVSLRYTPKHYLKGIREGGLPNEDFVEMGRDMPEGIKAAKLLVDAGYDALNVDLGCYDSHYWSHPAVYHKEGLYLDGAFQVRQAVEVPVIVAGKMGDPDFAAQAYHDGKCDMIGLGRPVLADPYLVQKIRLGQSERIRHCIGCNHGCSARVSISGCIGCSINPQCANELRRQIFPALKKKKVVIVGGGPGGSECARVCALRGHDVVLFEKKDHIGGQLLPASRPAFKKATFQLAQWYEHELKRLKVDLRLNTAATRERIAGENADTVVMALGARPMLPSIPGIRSENTFLAVDVLNDIGKAKANVVVIGAGLVGVETAVWLLQEGRNITLVEITDAFMPDALKSDAEMAMDLIIHHKGRVLLSTEVVEITGEGVRVRDKQKDEFIKADTVIIATGYLAENEMYQQLEQEFGDIYNIGDSKAARNIYSAIHEGFELGSSI